MTDYTSVITKKKADAWESVPCRQTPDLFFPEGKGAAVRRQAEEAVRVCGTCDLREACLSMALTFESGDHWHRFGIFGGTTPEQRAKLAKHAGTAA